MVHIVNKEFEPLCNVMIGNDEIITESQYDTLINPPEVCNKCFFKHMDNKYKNT